MEMRRAPAHHGPGLRPVESAFLQLSRRANVRGMFLVAYLPAQPSPRRAERAARRASAPTGAPFSRALFFCPPRANARKSAVSVGDRFVGFVAFVTRDGLDRRARPRVAFRLPSRPFSPRRAPVRSGCGPGRERASSTAGALRAVSRLPPAFPAPAPPRSERTPARHSAAWADRPKTGGTNRLAGNVN